ncbi:unnamed protein product [Rhodiola kirilowii]
MAYYYSDADHHPFQSQYQSQYQPQYHHQYYFAPPQTLAPQTYYYSDGYNCYEVSNGYYYGYGNQSPRFPVAYSVAGYSEPKRVHWEDGGVDRVNMDLVVDREEEEVDDGYDDDDFDPTPYDGGYDLVAAYGKPLPASDAICYPRSGNDSEVRTVVVSDPAPVPVPVHIPDHVSTPVSEAIVPLDGLGYESGGDGNESDSSCGSEMSECEDGDAEDEEAYDGDVRLSVNGFHDDGGDGRGGYGDREYEKVAVSNDAANGYESNSESPGFCDGLYGYLPCLNKKRNKTIMSGNSAVENAVSNDAPNGYESNTKSPSLCDGIYGYLPCLNKKRNEAIMSGNSSVENSDEDHWRAAADFIFGSLNPYDGVPDNTNYSTYSCLVNCSTCPCSS